MVALIEQSEILVPRALIESGNGPDVRIIDGGSVLLFVLLTAEARAWVEAHVSDDRQMLGTGLAVEPRYAAALADGMAGDNLIIEADDTWPIEETRPTAFASGTDEDLVEAVITIPRQSPTGDRYDLGWLFTCWAWEAGSATGTVRWGRWRGCSEGWIASA